MTNRSSSMRWLAPLALSLLSACTPKPIPDDRAARVPLAAAPVWRNWSENLVHRPERAGENYYFSPTSRRELETILAQRPEHVTLRVSGQRHSQPPLVIGDNRAFLPETADIWLIDLSCYADLGANGTERILLEAAANRVTVNAGVREDELDAFLTRNDFMLRTVTAGGFFSIGGMTAVDVHGGTVAAPIFAETASSFTIVDASGRETTLDARTPAVAGWSPLQFARVSLGALGIVTRVTLEVVPRPFATSLASNLRRVHLSDRAAFVKRYGELLERHDRIESFFNPYRGRERGNEALVLTWDVDEAPRERTPNRDISVASACTIAERKAFGAPYEPRPFEKLADRTEAWIQEEGSAEDAKLVVDLTFDIIESQVRKANAMHSELWLQESARVVFMSYFLELPHADEAGLARAWEGLNVVTERLALGDFRVVAPIEFRFIRGGDSALSGTYASERDALFVNFDLIGFVPSEPATRYPEALLRFFADVEQRWVALGGFPHNGKMYGFYDPAIPSQAAAPFQPAFLSALADRRGERLRAFEAYRRSVDPAGVFCNDFLRTLTLCGAPAPPRKLP